MYERSLDEIRASGVGVLPQSLAEAVDELRRDQVVQAALGPIAAEFIAWQAAEWAAYHSQVSRWEVDRYLTSL